MPLTDGAWLPRAAVLAHVGVADNASTTAADVERARLAAAAFVERLRPDLLVTSTAADGSTVLTYAATPDVVEAGLLVAARLHARKGSPTGLASYGEFGPAAVLRFDPDVDRLLQLGRHSRPTVG